MIIYTDYNVRNSSFIIIVTAVATTAVVFIMYSFTAGLLVRKMLKGRNTTKMEKEREIVDYPVYEEIFEKEPTFEVHKNDAYDQVTHQKK